MDLIASAVRGSSATSRLIHVRDIPYVRSVTRSTTARAVAFAVRGSSAILRLLHIHDP